MLKSANISAFKIGKSARQRIGRRGLGLLSIALAASALIPTSASARENDAVRVWNERAVVTLTNTTSAGTPGAGFSPTVAFIHLAMVQGAVYDAVNAIKGGHDPYIAGLQAPTSASKGAAAATAAYHVLAGVIDQAPTIPSDVKFSIKERLYSQYASSIAEIPEGQARDKGIEVGAAAAAAMLANRAGDGRFGPGGFPVSDQPGGWRPVPPTNGNDPNGWVRNVRPFALPNPDFYQTPGPSALTSDQYTADFNEVKEKGAATGSTRTEAQTMLAYWSNPNPVPMAFTALRQVSGTKHLTISEEARFYAMTSVTAADSVINCFAEKGHWTFWRPTTAIRLADTDGNPATLSDSAWTSLLGVPPYPDEPSGANCVFAGVMTSAKLFFGNDAAEFDIPSAGIGGATGSTRHYSHFTDVIPDMIEARIYAGLHFRRADVDGAELGRKVAEYVDANFFNCGPAGQCKQERRD